MMLLKKLSGGNVMESRSISIACNQDKNLKIKIIPGHFATNHSHINYYIDMTKIKCQHVSAKKAGEILAKEYINRTQIDTIICMDGTEIIAAFLAEALCQNVLDPLTRDKSIAIITPENNSNSQMIFRDNVQNVVWNKNILLLIASATTGKTIIRSLECIKYYGGNVKGISAIFSDIDEQNSIKINRLFSSSDILDYKTYTYHDCPFCKDGQKIDAIVNSFGYSKI